MPCFGAHRNEVELEVKPTKNSDNAKNNNTLRLASVTTIDYSNENLRKIGQVLSEVYGNSHVNDLKTPGISGYYFTAQYQRNDGTHAVFVDVSREKRDDGKVYALASKDQIERFKEKLENALGIKLDNA